MYLENLGASIEVPIEMNGSRHRADAVMKNGLVVELQCSGISIDEIAKREAFYKEMIWVFDARQAYAEARLLLVDRGRYYTFRWKQPRKSIAYAEKPVRLDLGGGEIFRLKKMHHEAPCGGWGNWSYVHELDRGES